MIRRIDTNKQHERRLFETHFIPETRPKDYENKSIKEFIDSRLEHLNGVGSNSNGLLENLRDDIRNTSYDAESQYLHIIYQDIRSLDEELRRLDELIKTKPNSPRIKLRAVRILLGERDIRQKFGELVDYRINQYMKEFNELSLGYKDLGYDFPQSIIDNLINLAHKYANSRSFVFKSFRMDAYELIKGSMSLYKIDPERLDKQFEFLEHKYDLLTGIRK